MSVATVVLESTALSNLFNHLIEVDNPDNPPATPGRLLRHHVVTVREWLESNLIEAESVDDTLDSVTHALLVLTLDELSEAIAGWSDLGELVAAVPYSVKGGVVLVWST